MTYQQANIYQTFLATLLLVAAALSLKCTDNTPAPDVNEEDSRSSIIEVNEDTLEANRLYKKAKHFQWYAQYDSSNVYFELARKEYQKFEQILRGLETEFQLAHNSRKAGKFALADSLLSALYDTVAGGQTSQKTLLAHIILEQGISDYEQNRFTQALERTDSARSIFRINAPDSLELGICDYFLAITETARGNYKKARELHHRSLDLLLSSSRTTPEHLALSYGAIGINERNSGNFDKARSNYLVAKDYIEDYMGTMHPRMAMICYNLGMLYNRESKYRQALEYLQQALNIRESQVGSSHHMTSKIYNVIGNSYSHLHRYYDAEKYYRLSLESALSVFDKPNKTTAIAYCNIGNIQRLKFKFIESEKSYLQGLKIFQSVHHGPHHHIAHVFRDLSQLSRDRDSLNVALTYIEQSILQYQKTLGTKHYRYLQALHTKASVEMRRQTFVDAFKTYQKSLENNQIKHIRLNEYENPRLETVKYKHLALDALRGKASVLYDLALIDWQHQSIGSYRLNELKAAAESFQLMFACLDSIKQDIDFDHRQIEILEETVASIETAIKTHMLLSELEPAANHADILLEYFERSKSALLGSGDVGHAKAVIHAEDSSLAILEKYDKSLTQLEHQLVQLHEQEGTAEQERQLKHDKFRLYSDYLELLNQVKSEYPEYIRARYISKMPSIEIVQKQLITTPNHAIVQYYLATDALYALCITRDSASVISTPLSYSLDDAAIAYRRAIIARQPRKISKLTAELYNTLIKPLNLDPNITRLTIIPDAHIGLVPFELLFHQNQSDVSSDMTMMQRNINISYAGSCRELLRTSSRQNGANQWLGFAPSLFQ